MNIAHGLNRGGAGWIAAGLNPKTEATFDPATQPARTCAVAAGVTKVDASSSAVVQVAAQASGVTQVAARSAGVVELDAQGSGITKVAASSGEA
jgi:hypothetical protein